MAKLKAPLLSMGASGQIGKSMVIGSWRGVPYARQHVTPANPKTAAQTTTRNTFSSADDQFKKMLSNAQAPWKAAAKGRAFTARNAFIRDFVAELRGKADFADYVASPGVNGGLSGTNLTVAGGSSSGEIDVSIDVGQAPVDWEQPTVIFTAVKDHDPVDLLDEFVAESAETGAGSSYSPPQTISYTFTGLTAGSDYAVSAILVWTRADGVTAYGPSNTAIGTATA